MPPKRASFVKITSIAAVLSALLLASCASNPTQPAPNTDLAPENSPTDSTASIDAGPQSSDVGNAQGLQTLHFDYRSTEISPHEDEILQENAEILKRNTHLLVQLEGHCDQRGPTDLNLRIGAKRAAAVRKRLIAKGVAPLSVVTISYGKDQPLDRAQSEEAWRKNRRVNFLILAR